MKKFLSTNTMILLASLLLSLTVMELILRGFLPEDMSNTWALRVPHPEFGWSLQVGVGYHYRMTEDLVHVKHNSKGFHDGEHSYENPTGIPRIIVLGDSFMEAFSVKSGETFYSQLARRLQEAGRPVEVINLGVGGYGTLQEYLVYMAEGRRYRPDVVLLGFYFGNDLRNNNLELETIVTGGSMKVMSRPFLDASRTDKFAITTIDYEGAIQRYNTGVQAKDTLLRRLAEHLAIFRALEMARDRLFPAQTQITADEQEQLDFVALGMHFCEEPSAFTRAWGNTRRILEQLNGEVRASGAELVIFTVTAEHEADPALMRSLAADFYDPDALCLDTVPAYQRLRGISDELGVTYIDLMPEFHQGAVAGKDFFLADRHWNAASHALAAARVTEVLLERTSFGR
jgi:hypothetical protein